MQRGSGDAECSVVAKRKGGRIILFQRFYLKDSGESFQQKKGEARPPPFSAI